MIAAAARPSFRKRRIRTWVAVNTNTAAAILESQILPGGTTL